MYFAADSNTII